MFCFLVRYDSTNRKSRPSSRHLFSLINMRIGSAGVATETESLATSVVLTTWIGNRFCQLSKCQGCRVTAQASCDTTFTKTKTKTKIPRRSMFANLMKKSLVTLSLSSNAESKRGDHATWVGRYTHAVITLNPGGVSNILAFAARALL